MDTAKLFCALVLLNCLAFSLGEEIEPGLEMIIMHKTDGALVYRNTRPVSVSIYGDNRLLALQNYDILNRIPQMKGVDEGILKMTLGSMAAFSFASDSVWAKDLSRLWPGKEKFHVIVSVG